ncbi:dTDP-4-dehydrorhamnose 3,5-epimerase [Nitrosopumilus ureiphilus]|uniref:dTDP-4-dehydrorhamnose 3,5-epimerase n=1 Tax=Nitrosopumilus ureiphilus TaxID=1470067 RepID=A0A7D5M2Z3_9ARCH|nr:dTDP-4-dehydrorhamnose 3,5-epimerase [Nitrosopumilus ureiphilus]QLH05794.1 dTDP-4-dehydrorhamnose 3,5-epimerase [Nitrosopumilus ureiphilus]
MIFKELKFEGVFKVELEKIEDNRGFFSRSWDKKEFQENGLNSNLIQCNISFNKTKGTIRGLHFQKKPHEEAKYVRCTKGRVYEVFVDLRKNSKTFLKWGEIELDSEKLTCLYIPEGFALGFQTLEDDSELFYQMSQWYKPELSTGIVWNDKELGIQWPIKTSIISEKDLSLPNLDQALKELGN